MASVTGFTAERMKEIEDKTVVGGHVNESGDLILNTRDGGFILGGHVVGAPGAPGTIDPVIIDDINGRIDENTEQINNSKIQAKPPTGLVVMQNSAAFLDDGRVYTQVYFAWDSVILDVTNQPVTIAEYEIWSRTTSEALAAPVKRSTDNEMIVEGWRSNVKQHVSVRARAVGSNVWSELSGVIEVIPAIPSINVAVVPSTPIAFSAMKMIYIEWDGNFVGGTKPPGFQKVVGEVSSGSATGPWNKFNGSVVDKGQLGVFNLPPGIQLWFRFRWVDTLGRESGPSAVRTSTSVGLTLPDITGAVQDAIDAAQDAADQALDSLVTVVKSVFTEYAVNSSESTAPTTGWSAATPTRTPGTFIWSRTTTTYADNTSTMSNPVLVTGNSGTSGKGIASSATTYQVGSSGTTAPTGTWLSTVPATAAGQFLWTRTIVTYTDSTTSTAYSVAAHGTTGTPGTAGKGITSTAITYQVGSSGTTAPTGTWLSTVPTTTVGQFLWTRTIITYTDATTSTAYSVAAHGASGSAGSAGVSVSSITPYFLLVGAGSPAPAKPTANPPGGSWSLTEPAYVSSTDLYRTELVLYSNSTFAYTNVSKVSSYTAAVEAITVANLADAAAKGMVKASVSDPGHVVGRIWLILNGSGQVIGVRQSNGTVWTSYALMADQILVPSSVGTVSIANGAVIASKMVIGDFTNLIDDPNFELAYGTTWAGTGWTIVGTSGAPGKALTATPAGTTRRTDNDNFFSVKAAEKFYMSVRAQNTTNASATMSICWRNESKTLISSTVLTIPVASGWVDYEITGAAPTGAFYGQVIVESGAGTTGQLWISKPRLHRKVVGVLIEDGAVTASKVTMDQGFADVFWANEGNFGKISVNMVKPAFGANLDISASGSINLITGQLAEQQTLANAQQSKINQLDTEVSNAAIAAGNAQSTADAGNTAAAVAAAAAAAAQDELNNLGQYIKIDQDGMNFSTPNSPTSLQISNDDISFRENGVATTWWDSGQMIAPKFVGSEFTLDNHKIEAFGADTIIRRV